jgi:glutathione synthase/RimK-type ligase-like ATP-grasp enzyme
MKSFIYPYKAGSHSAKALAKASNSRRIKREGSKFVGTALKVVVNWGSSTMPRGVAEANVLNRHIAVKQAGNKLAAFRAMEEAGVSIPPFTDDIAYAKSWILHGQEVVCRKKLTGYGGDGIVMASTMEEMVPAPLYTRYIKKISEWRVHVFRDEIIMLQRKARRLDVPDDQVNWQVRNHDNGFIFEHMEVNPPVQVVDQSMKAVEALKLDFGAVDVVFNERDDEAYVLEINCAPGLEGTTLERYSAAIERYKHDAG